GGGGALHSGTAAAFELLFGRGLVDEERAEQDEHLILGGGAKRDRARVAVAVAGARRGIAFGIDAATGRADLSGGTTGWRRAGSAGEVADRIRRRRLALHLVRIGVAIVVQAAVRQRPLDLGCHRTAKAQRRIEARDDGIGVRQARVQQALLRIPQAAPGGRRRGRGGAARRGRPRP